MKKLIFIRHGKAEDQAPECSDFERSLTTKGKTIAKVMVHELKKEENTPGILVTSPAFRALETALIFAGEYGIEYDKIIMDSNIYSRMSLQYILKMIDHLDVNTDTITLFGHNPSFSEITNSLCRDGCDYMPKCGIAGISFNIKNWHDLRRKTGTLEYFLKPDKSL
jgi:phosphohistidine phosphatase